MAVSSLIPPVVLPVLVGVGLAGQTCRVGTAWWCGVLSASWMAFLGFALGVPQAIVLYVTFAIAVALAVRGIYLSAISAVTMSWLSTMLRVALMLACFAVPVLATVAHTLYAPARGDGAVIWYAKTRALLDWVPFKDMPYTNYPDLGPAAWMLVLKWLGSNNEAIGRAILPAGFFAWILALLELFPRPFPWSAALVLPVLATTTIDLEAATNGAQDFFLSAAAGVAFLYLLRLVCKESTRRCGRDAVFLACFLGSLPLIKQEGAVLALILGAAWLLAGKQKIGIFIAAPLALVWPAFQMLRGLNVLSVQGDAFTVGSVLGGLRATNRLAKIAPYLLRGVESSAVPLVVFGLLAVYCSLALPRTRRAVFVATGLLIVHTAFVVSVFMATRQPLEWHLATAFSRLFGQQRFILITSVAYMLAQCVFTPRAEAVADSPVDGAAGWVGEA